MSDSVVISCFIGLIAGASLVNTFGCEAIAASIPTTSPAVEEHVQLPAGAGRVRIPLTRAGEWLCTRVQMHNHDIGWFIIDTGATSTVVDQAVAQQLSLEKRARIPVTMFGRTMMTDVVEYDDMFIGPIKMTAGLVANIDLSGLSQLAGFHVAGILGNDFLRADPFTLDFVNASLTVYRRSQFSLPKDATAIPLMLREFGLPAVPANIEGHDGWLQLDSGLSGSPVIFRPFFEQHYDTLAVKHPIFMPPVSGSLAMTEVDSITALGRRYSKLSIQCVTGAAVHQENVGVLGARQMMQGTLTFDYSRHTLWVSWEQGDAASKMLSKLTVWHDLTGYTSLMYASELGRGDVVSDLLRKGADPNVATASHATALTYATGNGYSEIVELLLSKGAHPDIPVLGTGQTALHLSVLRGDLNTTKLLVRAGAPVDARQADGQSPLHMACQAGNSELARFLIDSGANVNLRSQNGMTPLMCAAVSVDPSTTSLLLDRGADIGGPSGLTALHIAAGNGNIPVATILLQHGAQINARDAAGYTPLIAAVKGRHEGMVHLLMKNGADVTQQGADGKTALDCADDLDTLAALLFSTAK
jgi:ankyrin repeat protein